MIILLIATRNAHKAVEIRTILGERFHYLTLQNFPNAPETVEDAETFAGNATKKAVELARWLARRPEADSGARKAELYVLADDSGLEVDALDGAPGVHSARFAARDAGDTGNSSDEDNRSKLLRLLKDVAPKRRRARFRCVVALAPLNPPAKESASPVCYAN